MALNINGNSPVNCKLVNKYETSDLADFKLKGISLSRKFPKCLLISSYRFVI